MESKIIIRLAGEFATKTPKVRKKFLQRLLKNLRAATKIEDLKLIGTFGNLHFNVASEKVADVLASLANVFGIAKFAAVETEVENSLEAIGEALADRVAPKLAGKTFCVRVKKANNVKLAPTPKLERELGAVLYPHANGVDLKNPDRRIDVYIGDQNSWIIDHMEKGPAGLPLGSQGRGLALFSGGMDSCVASWRLMKRGVSCDFLFCNLGAKVHLTPVLEAFEHMAKNWAHGFNPRLYTVDFLPLVEFIQTDVDKSYRQMTLKYAMYQMAYLTSKKFGLGPIITGESIGQVSTQTLPNLVALDQTVPWCVMRPLIGHDKVEIQAEARKIGVLDICERVQELCQISNAKPTTRANRQKLFEIIESFPEELFESALGQIEIKSLDQMDLLAHKVDALYVDEIPKGAKVIIVGESGAKASQASPQNLVSLIYVDEAWQFKPDSQSKSDKYVVYCEHGTRSAFLAESLQSQGIEAYCFRGTREQFWQLLQPHSNENEQA